MEKLQEKKLKIRLAMRADANTIWQILQQAIERRRLDGSQQWQDGYPNTGTVQHDIEKGWGYVLSDGTAILAYGAIIPNNEPAYDNIQGAWLTSGDFLAVHRVAVSNLAAGRGIATRFFLEIEQLAISQNIPSIKVDTNFDNPAMLKILEKLHYTYCGEVMFRGAPRKAFEKVFRSSGLR